MPFFKVYQPPTFEPVTLEDVKSFLRIDSTDFTNDTTEVNSISPATHDVVPSFGLVGNTVNALGFSGRIISQLSVAQITTGGELTVRIRESSDAVYWTTVYTFEVVNSINDNQILEYQYNGAAPYLRAEATVADGPVPFSVSFLKDAAASPDDAILSTMITQAREVVENYARTSLCDQIIDYWVDGVPSRATELPRGPVTSIVHVQTFDDQGNVTTIPASVYYLDDVTSRVIFKSGFNLPTDTRQYQSMRVRYHAGEPTRLTVPAVAKRAMMQIVGHFYEARDGSEIQSGTRLLLDMIKIHRV